MEYRTLDLTLISAKDLKTVNLLTPMRVYALVNLSSNGPRLRQRIAADRDGGRNPNWNATLHFTVPAGDPTHILLRVLLRADRILGDRDVGVVHIPLLDIIANAGDARFHSYQVRRLVSGKPKGVLNVSYKINDPIAPHSTYPPLPVVAAPTAEKAAKPDQEPVTPAMPMPMPTGYGYPSAGYGYPPAYGYWAPAMPMPTGYGYPPVGYGYGAPTPSAAAVKPRKEGNSGIGLAAGIMGGALGGLLIGDMISDAAAYDAGLEDGLNF